MSTRVVECDSCAGSGRESQQFPNIDDDACGACDGTGLAVDCDDEDDFDIGGEAGTE